MLQRLYKLAPFPLTGDAEFNSPCRPEIILSVLICACRAKELQLLLSDLRNQTFSTEKFEIILLYNGEDKDEIAGKISQFYTRLPNICLLIDTPNRIIADLRNQIIAPSTGRYLLFLDDDTRIYQKDFLEKAVSLFEDKNIDGIMPQGKALYCPENPEYDYIDRYSFATRCCFYRREVIEKAGGFYRGLKAYDDIELSIRLNIMGVRMLKGESLTYFHPPLYFDSMRKPISIGQSILKMRERYSLLVWLAVLLNALRFLPLIIIPIQRYRQWGKISLGVFLSIFSRKQFYY